MKKAGFQIIALMFVFSSFSAEAALKHSIPCPFDSTQTCLLERDILNDLFDGQRFYTVSNNSQRGLATFLSCLVSPYRDELNVAGQLKLTAFATKDGDETTPPWYSGEIKTYSDSSQQSQSWTTNEITHGYLEVVVKLPKCELSSDGMCQQIDRTRYPHLYNTGLWPTVMLMPTISGTWPRNGEIDLIQAYAPQSEFKVADAVLHFEGYDNGCIHTDCAEGGLKIGGSATLEPLYTGYHTWGFEWQPDPDSQEGFLITGYFNNIKIYGPIKTDSLPGDGKGAFSRGFANGYYLAVNLSLGGYAGGNIDKHIQLATLYLQSAKAYTVTVSSESCPSPQDIKVINKKNSPFTLTWGLKNQSNEIKYFVVSGADNKPLWRGKTLEDRTFIADNTINKSRKVTYYLYSVCEKGQSAPVKYEGDLQTT